MGRVTGIESAFVGQRPAGDPHARRLPSRRPRRRLVVIAVLALVVLLAVWAAWVAADGLRARSRLQTAADSVQHLQEQVLAGDRAAADATLTALQEHAAAAHDLTHGPHWSAARRLPWAGAHVSAVQTVSDVVDSLASDALPGLMDAAALVDPARLAPVDGRVDLAPLQAAGPGVAAADRAVQDALRRVDAIDTSSLVEPVARPVEDLTGQVRDVAMTTATAARAVDLLPAMLGAQSPRHYLLLVQNNAEPRALGGIPGAVILLRADAGAVELVELRNASGVLAELPEPALPLTDVERSLFGRQLGIYMADVTFTPDYPRAASIAQAIWEQRVGGEIDGVVSIDTAALAAVLGAVGPVDLPPGTVSDAVGGRLTAENAVEVLNNTVYRLVEDTREQDAFFAATGGAVFGAVMSGQGDAVTAIRALSDAADDGTVMVWSARPEEQDRLAGTVLSGELRGAHGDRPVVGLYVNDGTGSKIGYYLRAAVDVTPGACAADGTRLVEVAVTMTSTAPPDVVAMPRYISGGRVLEPGRMRFNLLAYAPREGYVEDAVDGSGRRGGSSQVHDDLFVLARTIELAPGESTTVTYSFRTGPGQTGAPLVRVTPLVDRHVDLGEGWRCS